MRTIIGLIAVAAILALLSTSAFAMSEGEREIQFKAKCIDLTLKDVIREVEGLKVKARADELAGIILVLRELQGLIVKEQWDINQDLQQLRLYEQQSKQEVDVPSPVKKGAPKKAPAKKVEKPLARGAEVK